MIITKLIGGIGNQMFQYAVARRLAHIHHEEFKLDITGYRDYKLRSYHLNPFKIIEKIASDNEIYHQKNIRYVREEYFHFNPSVLNLGGNVYLEGYWQSEKYFKDIEPIIRSEFILRDPPAGENARLVNQMRASEAVSVHIRRGDYATNPVTNSYHGICSLDYYYRAVAMIAGRVRQPHLYIFSDDWGWAQQNFHPNIPMTIVAHNANWPNEDLRLMCLCKYHIIANSTFSWWGAWLANFADKIVIAPQKWFNSQDKNTADLIPENWILI